MLRSGVIGHLPFEVEASWALASCNVGDEVDSPTVFAGSAKVTRGLTRRLVSSFCGGKSVSLMERIFIRDESVSLMAIIFIISDGKSLHQRKLSLMGRIFISEKLIADGKNLHQHKAITDGINI
ncbi:hypothetical protein L6452_01453 [Arctium lappa]|uniref:Uncharacterized protein n=1 Tax=Arctium lappa TaxID=4217 RepID=A0ACB9FGQ5_ARCLA|nr:hypothetical protein L6452_01453 [Arctium lappa]